MKDILGKVQINALLFDGVSYGQIMMNDLTREIFHSLIILLQNEAIPLISRQEYQKMDGKAEAIIRIQRGLKHHFRNAGHFWLMVILSEIRNETLSNPEWYLQAMLNERNICSQEISHEEFKKNVQLYDFVKEKHDFSLHGQFRQAWLMYDKAAETAVLAETDDEFVAFFWELLD